MRKLLVIIFIVGLYSVKAQSLQKESAFQEMESQWAATNDPKEKSRLYTQMVRSFPQQDLDFVHYTMATFHERNKNTKGVDRALKPIKNMLLRAAATGELSERIMNYDPKKAKSLLQREIGPLYTSPIPSSVDKITDQSHPGSAKSAYLRYMDLYSRVLIKEQNYKEALKYITLVYEHMPIRSDILVADYALALSKNGEDRTAIPLLESRIASGKGNPSLKEALKESYKRVDPAVDAENLILSLEAKLTATIQDEVLGQLIDAPCPDVALVDVSGNRVSIREFAGKIIILDFWASWCMPCKASFPSMQMAVDKYKNDPNVQFLFINTFERSDKGSEEAAKYLKDNQYTFAQYADKKDDGSNQYTLAHAFGINAIPQKIIIDGNGRIRFKVSGFKGGDDAAVAELSAMIELIK